MVEDPDAKHPNKWTNRRDPVMTRFPATGYTPGDDQTNRPTSNAQITVLGAGARDTLRDEDPREALLKYAKDAESKFFTVSQFTRVATYDDNDGFLLASQPSSLITCL
jgi:hypothetical protein